MRYRGLAGLMLWAGAALSLPAQDSLATRGAAAPSAPPWPFRPGERLEYQVSFGKLRVGSGAMMMLGIDTLEGRSEWHAMLTVSGGIPLLRVNDTTMSWFDTTTFVSRRFVQYLHEGRYQPRRVFRISPAEHVYVKNDEPPEPTSLDPLDDVSLLYFVRTLPLAVGDRYEFHRYFQPEGNPVVIRVVRRERITVPAGSFPAIVVEPEITTTGIFSRGGHARLWFSDDSARVLLQMKSGLTFGSINLYLSRIVPGRSP